MLKFSVVTPCFNQASTLENTLRSVLDQGYPNLEYIVIDGGSSDGSLDILRKYEHRLHYCCSEPDGGQYQAINKGFSLATGEAMAWINGDDFYLPGALRAVGSIFSTLPEVEWITSLSQVTADAAGSCIGCKRMPGFSRQAFLDGAYLPAAGGYFLGFIQQESTFWRRSLWERAGPLDLRYNLAGDFDLWTRFFRHTPWLYCSPSPWGCFRYIDGQKSNLAYEEYLKEAHQSLRRLRDDLHWRQNHLRQSALTLRLPNFPYFKPVPSLLYTILQHLYQYEGQAVVRRCRGNPDPSWEVKKHTFLAWALAGFPPHYAD